MLSRESISDVQKHFTHVVNHLLALAKTFIRKELNVKVLKSVNNASFDDAEKNSLDNDCHHQKRGDCECMNT